MEVYNDCLLGLSYASTNDADDEKKDSFYQQHWIKQDRKI